MRSCRGCGEAPCGCYIRCLVINGETRYLDVDHPDYDKAPRSYWERQRPHGL